MNISIIYFQLDLVFKLTLDTARSTIIVIKHMFKKIFFFLGITTISKIDKRSHLGKF